ncbi:hypothetical protein GCM10018987_66950 [Streptomyces cremeus]
MQADEDIEEYVHGAEPNQPLARLTRQGGPFRPIGRGGHGSGDSASVVVIVPDQWLSTSGH